MKLHLTKQELMAAPATVGQQTHINHENCPAGTDTKRRLYLKRTANAVLAYCHHCNGHGVYKSNTRRSLTDIKRELINKSTTTSAESVVVPDDMLAHSAWPIEARVWWDVCELDAPLANTWGIGWSPSYNRLIVPYYDTDGLCVHWQGRDVYGTNKLKWLTATSSRKPLGVYDSGGNPANLSIVEDPISAIKLATHADCIAMCLYGVTMSDEQLAWIVAQSSLRMIVVWLDPDAAGRYAAAPLTERLRTMTDAVCLNAALNIGVGMFQPKIVSKHTLSRFFV